MRKKKRLLHKECVICQTKFDTRIRRKLTCGEKCSHALNLLAMKKSPRAILGITIPKEDWIMDGYKEPIKKLENGFGYYGVVTRSKDKEYVRSSGDGYFYKALNTDHAKRFGFENLKEYKKYYGLSLQTPLCGISRSKEMHERAVEYFQHHGSSELKKNREKAIQSNKDRKGEKVALEIRNKRGTCPDQLLDKIKVLAKELGRTPTPHDFKMKFAGQYMGILYYYFGSWMNAVELAGFVPESKANPRAFTSGELLKRLRLFVETHGYTPLWKDFGTDVLPTVKPYYKFWRTLNAARLNAGIPLVMSWKHCNKKLVVDAEPEVFI